MVYEIKAFETGSKSLLRDYRMAAAECRPLKIRYFPGMRPLANKDISQSTGVAAVADLVAYKMSVRAVAHVGIIIRVCIANVYQTMPQISQKTESFLKQPPESIQRGLFLDHRF